ncbi:MAG: NAD(P)/FAD-dependent oxidoreductase, partial [Actinobacteria bacterium]|nr:NAD(P)/FAD-dependent oxidoreductase [Actinomycetota bacterium]
MTKDFDVVVLGLGPGGEEVAEQLAKAGKAVLGVDRHLVGGECPYYGCVPSKMIIRAASTLAEARRVDELAGTASVRPDYAPVAKRIREEATDDWNDEVAVKRLTDAGGTFARGVGRFTGRADDGRLRLTVGDDEYEAARVVVAVGTQPALPPIDGLAALRESSDSVWTNREAMRATANPESVIVLGGGSIGVELCQAWARFGSRVTVLEAADRILAPEEPEAAEVVRNVLRREGVDVREQVKAVKVAAGGQGVELTLADGSTVSGEKLLVAAGRRSNLADIGLDALGLDPAARTVDVDEHMRVVKDGTPVDGLYSVGDVTGRGAFTHVSVWQARVLIAHILGRDEPYGGYHGLAWVTFTDPEVGRVGMSEAQARDKGIQVRVGNAQVPASARGWIHGPGNDGIVKLVEDVDRGVLVGATVVSPYGGEIV